MTRWLTILAAVGGIGSPTLAQPAQPAQHALYPDLPDAEAVIVPAGSPVKLAQFTREPGVSATFEGTFAMSGAYEVEGYGDDAFVSFWPDPDTIRLLPHWKDRGRADVLYLGNGWAFAQAVLGTRDLDRLKSQPGHVVRGYAKIIADRYETSIECDAAHFSANFVSVVRPKVALSGIDMTPDEC